VAPPLALLLSGLAVVATPFAVVEFRLGANAASREHLEKGLSLRMPPSEGLTRVALYHHALLLVRDSIEVRWPSGHVDRFPGTAAGRYVTLTEGGAPPGPAPAKAP
jgi:hypothetical protein